MNYNYSLRWQISKDDALTRYSNPETQMNSKGIIDFGDFLDEDEEDFQDKPSKGPNAPRMNISLLMV